MLFKMYSLASVYRCYSYIPAVWALCACMHVLIVTYFLSVSVCQAYRHCLVLPLVTAGYHSNHHRIIVLLGNN